MPNQTILTNNVSVVKNAPLNRLVDPQKVYSDVMKDAARRAVLENNTYPSGRKTSELIGSTGGASGDSKSITTKRNRAQRALYEGSSKKDVVHVRKPASKP